MVVSMDADSRTDLVASLRIEFRRAAKRWPDLWHAFVFVPNDLRDVSCERETMRHLTGGGLVIGHPCEIAIDGNSCYSVFYRSDLRADADSLREYGHGCDEFERLADYAASVVGELKEFPRFRGDICCEAAAVSFEVGGVTYSASGQSGRLIPWLEHLHIVLQYNEEVSGSVSARAGGYFRFTRRSLPFDVFRASAVAIRAHSASGAEPVLTDRQKEVLEYVRRNGPKTAKEIAKAISIGVGTLTRHIVPALRKHGLRNKRGAGYYVT